ncbi:hypothetical protein X474_15960 [Dethiosulfatarculus sandiegensis]|uniref:Uncharacterized protein n=1 Tax=Dethiosulfatarculus sandiegensis TaxID=1429043 RepID=A0A0D2J4M8_9BACT|nr:hypothetical protein X474_15960 [Dethiosulfatarculus sandiegensis]
MNCASAKDSGIFLHINKNVEDWWLGSNGLQ